MSWLRNLSDIFYIRSIPETFYYHLDTLVTGYCVPWLHVKQTRIGVDKCCRTPVFSLLRHMHYNIPSTYQNAVLIQTSQKYDKIFKFNTSLTLEFLFPVSSLKMHCKTCYTLLTLPFSFSLYQSYFCLFLMVFAIS